MTLHPENKHTTRKAIFVCPECKTERVYAGLPPGTVMNVRCLCCRKVSELRTPVDRVAMKGIA